MTDDTISRQAAIDEFTTVDIEGALYDCGTIVKKLKALPSAQPEQQWIQCRDRLPETEEQVLIYAWNVHYVLAKYKEVRTENGEYIKKWVMEDAYNAPYEIKHEVIKWMPLPKL